MATFMHCRDLDDRDRALLARRITLLPHSLTPRVGDYVDFADGVTRRISHVWDWEAPAVQTSTGGSFYLGDGFCAFSGGLSPAIPLASLAATNEIREGTCWFFHHDRQMAHNGIVVTIPWRVYRCTLAANQ